MIYAWPMFPANTISSQLFGPSMFGANGAYATIFQVARTGNIRTIHYATNNVITGATIDVRAETVDPVTGDPSGTLIATNTNGAQVIASSDDLTFFSTTLTADAPVVVGDMVAVRMQLPGGGGVIAFGAFQLGCGSNIVYGDQLQPPTWQKNNEMLSLAVEYDDGVVVPITGLLPPCTVNTFNAINTGTTPNVYGQRFTPAVSRRVLGAWTYFDSDSACAVRLVSTAYNSGAGTGILAEYTIDPEMRRDASLALRLAYFPAHYDLVAGTTYRLIIEPLTGTNSTSNYYNTGSQLGLDAWGFGCLTTATNPTGDGSWTNFNSGSFAWAPMGLLIDGDATGTASGGGSFTFVG